MLAYFNTSTKQLLSFKWEICAIVVICETYIPWNTKTSYFCFDAKWWCFIIIMINLNLIHCWLLWFTNSIWCKVMMFYHYSYQSVDQPFIFLKIDEREWNECLRVLDHLLVDCLGCLSIDFMGEVGYKLVCHVWSIFICIWTVHIDMNWLAFVWADTWNRGLVRKGT